MNTPLATYGLMIALAGVGGWAVSEAMEDDGYLPPMSPTSTAQPAPSPLALTLVTPEGTAARQGTRAHVTAGDLCYSD